MLKSCKLQKVGVECAGLEQTQLPHDTLKIPHFPASIANFLAIEKLTVPCILRLNKKCQIILLRDCEICNACEEALWKADHGS